MRDRDHDAGNYRCLNKKKIEKFFTEAVWHAWFVERQRFGDFQVFLPRDRLVQMKIFRPFPIVKY